MKLIIAALFFLAGAFGASTPRFVWEGSVDGVALLHVHGKRATVETTRGDPAVVRKSRFSSALPDGNQRVELTVVEGRGSVRVTQQPRLENDYEAVITIEDPQDGAGVYSIELRWSADRGSFDPDPKPWNTRDDFHHLEWRGRVNGSVVVECREKTCAVRSGGQAVSQARFKFKGALPSRDVRAVVDETTGRGTVRILEQPTRENGYTLRMALKTDMPGSEAMSFVVSWPR